MSTLLYMHIPGLPSCIKLSDHAGSVPRVGDRIRIDAGRLACVHSRKSWKQRLPAIVLSGMRRRKR